MAGKSKCVMPTGAKAEYTLQLERDRERDYCKGIFKKAYEKTPPKGSAKDFYDIVLATLEAEDSREEPVAPIRQLMPLDLKCEQHRRWERQYCIEVAAIAYGKLQDGHTAEQYQAKLDEMFDVADELGYKDGKDDISIEYTKDCFDRELRNELGLDLPDWNTRFSIAVFGRPFGIPKGVSI